MLYGWKENSMLTNCLIACAHLTVTISEIERDFGQKSSIFLYPFYSTPPLGGFPSEYRHPVWYGKTRMVWLPDGEKIPKISLFVLCFKLTLSTSWLALRLIISTDVTLLPCTWSLTVSWHCIRCAFPLCSQRLIMVTFLRYAMKRQAWLTFCEKKYKTRI